MININIWDDYYEDSIDDPCRLYIENIGIPFGIQKVYLECIYESIDKNFKPYFHTYEPLKLYPSLEGQMSPEGLRPRYEIRFKFLSHKNRELLLEELKKQVFKYSFNFYSES